MKIFMLADAMNVGGAETHVFELSRLFASRGHEVTVFSAGGALARRLAAVGVRHQLLPDALSPSVLACLARHLRREKPHAVHAHTRRRAFLCRLLLEQMDFPITVTAHAMFTPRFPLGPLSFFPPDTIAVSEDVALHLRQKFNVPSSHLTVIRNGVDTERFRPHPRRDAPFTVLTLGRQDEDSALAATLLCRIAPRLAELLDRPVRVVIAGGGRAFPRLLALAKEANETAGSPVVRLLGRVEDTAPLFAECDIFVGVSRAAMEALASGRPVVLCGNEGYLGPLDPSSLPLALRSNLCGRGASTPEAARLLADVLRLAKCSSEERARLGTFGRDAVCRLFDAEQMATETLAVYRRAYARFRASRAADLLLCGYYGYGNYGDELILRSIVAAQRERNAHLRIGVMTADGNAPTGTVGIRRYSLPATLAAIRKSGALILGGGSLLQDATSHRSLLYYITLIRLAHIFGVPVMLYANGIGPLSSWGERICRRALPQVDLISVRDGDSYALLRQMGIPSSRLLLGADPVLGACISPPSRKDDGLPRLPRIALFPKGGHSPARRLALARAVAALALFLELDVTVSAMNPREDGDAAQEISNRLSLILRGTPRRAVLASSHPHAVLRLIERSSLVIGERLHALILAFGAEIPTVGIDGDPKIGSFLREIGQPSCLCRDISPQELVSCAKNAISSPQSEKTRKELRKRANDDADAAYSLIAQESFKF